MTMSRRRHQRRKVIKMICDRCKSEIQQNDEPWEEQTIWDERYFLCGECMNKLQKFVKGEPEG